MGTLYTAREIVKGHSHFGKESGSSSRRLHMDYHMTQQFCS